MKVQKRSAQALMVLATWGAAVLRPYMIEVGHGLFARGLVGAR